MSDDEAYAAMDLPILGLLFGTMVVSVYLERADMLVRTCAVSAFAPAAETNAWLIMAWTSTVAGNISLLGSAANLIVCEQARRSQQYGYTLSFSHLQFGFPATLVVTGIGLLLIRTY